MYLRRRLIPACFNRHQKFHGYYQFMQFKINYGPLAMPFQLLGMFISAILSRLSVYFVISIISSAQRLKRSEMNVIINFKGRIGFESILDCHCAKDFKVLCTLKWIRYFVFVIDICDARDSRVVSGLSMHWQSGALIVTLSALLSLLTAPVQTKKVHKNSLANKYCMGMPMKRDIASAMLSQHPPVGCRTFPAHKHFAISVEFSGRISCAN